MARRSTMMHLKNNFFAIILVLVAFLYSSCGRSGERIFDIPPGNAETTLKTFATQADIDILINGSKVGAIKTPKVSGKMSVDNALKKILRGTELNFHYDKDSHAIVIFCCE